MKLSLAFVAPDDTASSGPTSYLVASANDDGSVDASEPVTAPPGEYIVRPACIEERSPPFRTFQPFDVTVEP
jgi:hypothetical protein